MEQDFVKIYNPANAKNLTPEQIKDLQSLTDDQLKQLAEAYPNNQSGSNYLILKNVRLADDKQVFQTSTFPNLYNLRTRHNHKHFVAISFASIMEYKGIKNVKQTKLPSLPVQDLTAKEISQAEGLKPTPAAIPVAAPQQPETFEDLDHEAKQHAIKRVKKNS